MIQKIDLTKLPSNPGCYIYKNNQNKIIYVGKAKNLKKRVNSYFSNKNLNEKTKALVKNIVEFDFIVTDTEVEALILENNLIKKNYPKYNINLKDSKRYAYLMLTDEKYPRLILARDRKKKGDYYGPFVSGYSRDLISEVIIKSFKLRTCKRLPKKECLRYHIGLCSAPCINNNKLEYDKDITYAKSVLSGNIKEVINNLNEEMQELSKNNQFENAISYREKIKSMQYLQERQKSERKVNFDQDIISYQIKDNVVYLLIFHSHKGNLDEKEEFVFSDSENFLEQFFIQYYSENDIPKEIIASNFFDNAKEFLDTISKKNITLTIPKIGEKKHLLDLADKNVELVFFSEEKKLEDLQKYLKLSKLPQHIECFDISHLSGTNTVASMVCFKNGIPDKSNYRRFKIRTVDGIDDFSSMKEVVYRRYHRLITEHADMPDLIVIDGGKGQLSSSYEILKELGLRIPLISLAKREEEVFVIGLNNPLMIPKKSKALLLLMAIRDEAHRFAINYNKKLRSKQIKQEFEDEI